MILIAYITYSKKYTEPIKQDLIFQSNAKNYINLFCIDEDDLAVDITGAMVTFIVKDKPSDADASAKINKEITDLTAPTAGNVLIEILPSECDDLIGNYLYQISIALSATGEEYILKQGSICFLRNLEGIES